MIHIELTFINVGYGDSVIVRSGDFTMLLDGGSALPEEFAGFDHRIRAAAYLAHTGVSDINSLMISHIHEDHVCGLEEILAQSSVGEIRIPFSPALFSAEQVLTPRTDAPRSVHLFAAALNAMGRLLKTASVRGIAVSPLRCGDELELPNGLRLSALAPAPAAVEEFEALLREAYAAADPTEALVRLDRVSNDSSLLLRLRGDGADCLLTGDSCPRNWKHADVSSLENVTVLKLPHHGQTDCISESLMARMPLEAVVTTSSSDRRYNSANAGVYEALRRLHPGVRLLFTDEVAYPPYFSNPDGAQAVQLVIDSGRIQSEFIKIGREKKGETT